MSSQMGKKFTIFEGGVALWKAGEVGSMQQGFEGFFTKGQYRAIGVLSCVGPGGAHQWVSCAGLHVHWTCPVKDTVELFDIGTCVSCAP